jgi:hypothetical protein
MGQIVLGDPLVLWVLMSQVVQFRLVFQVLHLFQVVQMDQKVQWLLVVLLILEDLKVPYHLLAQ